MSLSDIRSEIKTKLEAISGVENVYDFKRYCNDLSTYKDLFVKDNKVNTWEIERLSFTSNARGGHGDIDDTIHNFIIRGYYSVFDSMATEKTFQDLVESIRATFMNDPNLGGYAHIVHMPIEGVFSTNRLGGVMCHVVEIRINIEQRIQ